jgi:hypothetical protein
MGNQNKIILDLCGGTGSWSRPYKEAGYDVRLVTLPEYDVLTYEPPENVYGILAAPPCTEFSLAISGRKSPRNFEAAFKVVEACLKIIWQCRLKNKLKFWALENPKGFLQQFLGKPAFSFEHWQYGDNGIKPTLIWGYFNFPKKTVSIRPDNLTRKFPNGRINDANWSKPICPEWLDKSKYSMADLRAITPQGFIRAFYKANK